MRAHVLDRSWVFGRTILVAACAPAPTRDGPVAPRRGNPSGN
jgi:hypothetical protein